MQIVHPRCCGLDLHKQSIVACLLLRDRRRARQQREVRTFGTTTDEIQHLAAWLRAAGCATSALTAGVARPLRLAAAWPRLAALI